MNADELIDNFFSLNVDGTTMQRYLDELAANNPRIPQELLQREIDALQEELATLERRKIDLEAQVEQLGWVRMERLLVFLPIFFRGFWTVVRPDELAMMCGRLVPPTVTSPYPEPSPETVRFMKNRFQTLDAEERELILTFCKSLQHRLTVRADMREFL